MVDGVILLDKPKGLSSNQALQRVKRMSGAKKAGHTGTLDPMATGMLPICLGEATKLAQYLLSDSKAYTFTLKLGEQTDTADADGSFVRSASVPVLDRDNLTAVLQKFSGDIRQYPPMFSAIKQNGKPLYKLARQGIEVERQVRQVHISSLELLSFAEDEISLRVVCSTGTYIRVLGEDIAQELGTLGHLISLRRDYLSCFSDSALQTLDDIEQGRADCVEINSIPLVLETLHISDAIVGRLRHGQRILAKDCDFGNLRGECQVRTDDALIGIGEIYKSQNDNWQLKLKRSIRIDS